VVGTNPPHLGAAALPLASLTVTFDQDMAADDPSQAGSVLNLANYTLTGTSSGAVAIRSASYDAAARSVTLRFDPLAPDSFALHVAGAIASRFGATLGTAYNASFTTTVDLSSHVRIDFLNTRSSRADGTVSYDVRVTNIGDGDLLTPIVLALDPARYFQGQPVNAEGPNALGLWLITLAESLADGALHPGESTLAHTVTVSDPLWQRVDIGHGVYAVPAPNAPPVFESTPLTAARAGEAYAYTALAGDPGGGAVSYLLQSGPQGMAVDPLTGAVAWTPSFASPEQASVVLRAYDRSGAYAGQSFSIAVAGVNRAPQILDLPARIEIDEGQLFEMPLVATDADGDRLTFFADNLPGGAVIDVERQTLAWTPGFAAAGDYRSITLTVSDGLAVDRVRFDLTVLPVDQAPTLLTPPERTVREGDPIRIQLAASDPEGAPLYYSSRFLPGGSFLDPHTGEFEWTPGFTQAGTYHIPFSVGDGTSATSVTATITVLNVNGLPEFDQLGEWQVREGQTLFFRAFAFDPENPSFVPQDRLPDGLLTPLLESESTVAYTVTGLPAGATFDAETAMFVWTPGFMQAGTYTASFTASDDGDGTGTPGVVTLSVPITVLNANQAPAVPDIANRTLNRGELIEIPVVVTDADGNALTLSAAGLPAFATFTDNGDGRGVFRFVPGATDRGDHVLTVTATDDGDGGGASAARSSTRSFVVSVSVPNEAPQLAWIGDKVAVAGETLSFTVHAADVEENPLTFSFDALPAGATLTPQAVYGTALFTWTPTTADLGAHALTLRVADDGNVGHGPVGKDAQALRIVVRTANQAPVLQPVGDYTLSEGETLVLPLLAVDPDGDPLTFSATNLPAGATLDAQTGVLRWTPNLIQAGDYDGIVLSVSDGHRSDSETIALQVVNLNQAPLLTLLADQSTRETAELSFTLVANDFDGDPIAYASLNPLPAGARFDGRSATFTWTPNYDQAGEYRLSFLAQDPDGSRDTVDVTVRVDNLDRAPTLAVEKHQARIGETFRLALTAADPDFGTTLVYRAKGLPDGATLDAATGVIDWTPDVGQAGDSLVLVTVSDGELSTTEPLVLRASLAPAAPSVTIEQTPSFAAVPGQPVVVHVLASSFAPIATSSLTVNGLPVTLDSTGTARLKAGASGKLELVATATDADGLTSTATSTLRVRDPLDSAAPVAVLDSALHSARLSAPTELRATVADSNLDEWRLELLPFSAASTLAPLGGRGQGEGVSILATGNGSVTNDVLTTLDTGKFANGIYTLRLTASDMAGRISSSEALIEIAGAAKPGQFVRRETDLSVTLDGVALDLAREYDSLATTNAGSFGPGWRLALRDLDLQTDVPPTGREASGLANPFSLGTRVYLTLPTGERVGFTFTPEKHELPGITYYTPAFTADAGVSWTLNAINSKLSLAGNRLFDLGTGLPYNPALAAGGEAQLVLTAPDGTAYHLDAAHGVTAIVASSGKRLVVSDSGIVAANGDSVRFVSNADGQLASISGPGGERIVYGYDGEGRLSSVRRIADTESTHYGYEVGPAGRLSIVTGAQDLAIDYSAATPVAAVLTGDLGAARSYLATPFAGNLTAGAVDRLAFAVRPSEFASTASGSIYLGVVVEASDGSALLPGTPVIEGLTATASSASGGKSFALYALTQAEGARMGDVLHLLRVAGADAATAGAYSVQVFVAGDANGDAKVDGSDAAIVAGARGKRAGDAGYVVAADTNRDGVIDGVDSGLLFQNLGYAPNRPPVITPLVVKTHVDLAVSIPVSEFIVDPEGDPAFFRIVGATDGMARSLGDGRSVLFTPEATHAGSAAVQITAMDDYADGVPAAIDIEVSDAELVRLDFTSRGIRLQPGESERIGLVGDFEDQTNVALPAGYIHIESTDPESGSVSLDGVFHGLAIGTGAVVASRGSLEAATAFAVGVPQESADFLRYAIGLSLYPQSVSIPILSGQRELIVTGGDGANVTGADTGTRYFVSDKRVVSVSPDGLVRPLGVGQATVTIVNGGSEVSAPINVGVPVLASVIMDKNGAIVTTAMGTIASFAPSALAEGQPVSISSVAIGSLPIEAPDSLHALGAFELEFSAAEASVPIQITAPVAADIPAGTKVYFLRQAPVQTADGSEIQAWIQEDTGVVGSDGLARTSSPPHRGVVARGLYLIASATDAMGSIRGEMQASWAATKTALVHTGNAWIGSVVTGSAYALDLLPGTYTVVAFLTTALGLTTNTSGTLQVNAGRTTHSTLVPPSLPTLPGAPADPPQIRGVVLDIPSSGDPELVISGDRFTFANALAPADRRDGSQIEDAVVRFRDPGGRLVGEAKPLPSSSAVEIRVHVPVGVVVGQASVSVVRPLWELTSTGWDRRVERVSNQFHLNADARYIFAPLGGDGLVAAINGQTGELAARISVGGGQERPGPRAAVLTSDNTRAYVPLRFASGVSVIDTTSLHEVDVDRERDGTQFIQIAGAHPYWAVVDREDHYLYVSDEELPLVYVIDIRPSSAEYHHVGTIPISLPGQLIGSRGLRGMALSSDGAFLYVAASNGPQREGHIAVVDLRPPIKELRDITARSVIDAIEVGKEPFGVTASENPDLVLFTDKFDDRKGVGIVRLDRDSIRLQAPTYVDLTLGLAGNRFDVNNAVAVTLTADARYAFVTGFNEYRRLVPSYDPLFDIYGPVDRPVGGNVGIIRDPLGLDTVHKGPALVAATEGIPLSFPDNSVLSGDGKKLYVGFRAAGKVVTYDVESIREILDQAFGTPTSAPTKPGLVATLLSTPIDQVARDEFDVAIRSETPTGGLPQGLAAESLPLELLPVEPVKPAAVGGTDLIPRFRWQVTGVEGVKSKIYVSVSPAGEGLFPTDFAGEDRNLHRIVSGVELDAGVFEYELDEPRRLTAGQTYYWGVEATTSDGQHTARKFGTFQTAAVEVTGRGVGGVTVITHGYEPFSPDDLIPDHWAIQLGKQIAEASDGQLLVYHKKTGVWVKEGDSPTIALDKPIVLIADWHGESQIDGPGFAEAAADAMFASLVVLDHELAGRVFGDLPSGHVNPAHFHFIGHGQGAVVNSEIIQRLGIYRPLVSGIQMTTLDAPSKELNFDFDLRKFVSEVDDKVFKVVEFAKALGGIITGVGLPAIVAKYAFSYVLDKLGDGFRDKLLGLVSFSYQHFNDPSVQRWSNVGFADNYYQHQAVHTSLSPTASVPAIAFGIKDLGKFVAETLDLLFEGPVAKELKDAVIRDPLLVAAWSALQAFATSDVTLTVNGEEFSGADVNVSLNGRAGFVGDDYGTYGLGGPHDRVVQWYAGTVDLGIDRFPTEVALLGGGAIARNESDTDNFGRAFVQWGFSGDLVSLPTLTKYNDWLWYSARENERGAIAASTQIHEGIGEGWFYSEFGGGEPIHGTPVPTSVPVTSEPVPGVFNGNFDLGSADSVVENKAVPGWSLQGGSGADFDHLKPAGTGNALELSAGKWTEHNWFYAPPDAEVLGFDLRTPFSAPATDMVLQVYFKPAAGTRVDLGKVILEGWLPDTWSRYTFALPADIRGQVGKLGFELSGTGGVFDVPIQIDNVSLTPRVMDLIDSSAADRDQALFFSDVDPTDAGKPQPNPDLIPSVPHVNEQEIIIRNVSDAPIKIDVDVPANLFVTLTNATLDGSPYLDKLPGTLVSGRLWLNDNESHTLFNDQELKVGQELRLTIRAELPPKFPGFLYAHSGFGNPDLILLNGSIEVTHMEKQTFDLFYAADIADGDPDDGYWDFADTRAGNARELSVLNSGKASLEIDPLDSSFVAVSDSLLQFRPSAADNTPIVATLGFKHGGRDLGSINLRGKAVPTQTVAIDFDALRTVLTDLRSEYQRGKHDPALAVHDRVGLDSGLYDSFASGFSLGIPDLEWIQFENGFVTAFGGEIPPSPPNGIFQPYLDSGLLGYASSGLITANPVALTLAPYNPAGLDANRGGPRGYAGVDLNIARFEAWLTEPTGSPSPATGNLTMNFGLSEASLRYRLDQVINPQRAGVSSAVAGSHAPVTLAVDAVLRYAHENSVTNLVALGKLFGWSVAHEFGHNLGLLDEYEYATGDGLGGLGRPNFMSTWDPSVSPQQGQILRLALDDPSFRPNKAEIADLVQWYLELMVLDRANRPAGGPAFEPLGGMIARVGEEFNGSSGLPVAATASTAANKAGLSNGDFLNANPLGDGFAWALSGTTAVEDGVLHLREGRTLFSRASQEAWVPDGAQSLRVTLHATSLGSTDGFPPDAFEVALLDADTLSPILGTVGITGSDALFNLQADGRLSTSSRVLLNGLPPGAVLPDGAVTVDIDLTGIATDKPIRLYFDLLGFGAADSEVIIDDVHFVMAANTAPVARNDLISLDEDSVILFDVRANDTDAESDPLTVELLSSPTQGTLTAQADGSFRYQPTANFNGDDSFTYRLSDGSLQSNTATVRLAVRQVNDAPAVQADFGTLAEDGTLDLDVLANDSDLDGNALSIASTGSPAHGKVTVLADGRLRYTPDADYFGAERFTYRIADSQGGQATSEVVLTITPVADAPRALDDLVALDEGGSARFDVRGNDVEPDGEALIVEQLTSPAHGALTLEADGSFLYQPQADFFGEDSFTYRLSDGKLQSSVATVTLQVAAVNDAPTVAPQQFGTPEGEVLVGALVAADPDGDPLTFTLDHIPDHGALVLGADGSFRFTPATGFVGDDSFSFKVSDGESETTGRGQIRVSGFNHAPLAADDVIQVDENSTIQFDVLANDHDPENDQLTLELLSTPTHGVLTAQADGTFAYQPDSDFNGPDSFTYRLSDGRLLSTEATVRLDVQAVNYAPIVANDNGTLPEDGTLEIDVLANDSDPDGDTLALVAVGTPQNGRAEVLSDGRVRYTPRADFFGSDRFSYTVADPSGARSVATVTVSVTPVPDAPTTSTQRFSSLEDVTLSERLTATNPDGAGLSFAVVYAPAFGRLTLGSDGAFEYLPDAGFGGADRFTFSVGNGAGMAVGVAELTITPVNDAPVARGDSVELDEDGSVTAGVGGNDSDEEGDPIGFELVSGVAHGELAFAPDGTFSYRPVADFNGEDRFSYAASDGRLKSVRAVVHLVVRPVNDPPTAFDDVRTMSMNGTLDIDVLANDQDIDGDRLAVVRPGTPAHGTVSILAGGALRYVPLVNYYGDDSFTYVLADPSGSEAQAEVRIGIERVNSAPQVDLQTFVLDENTSLSRQLVASDVEGDALGFTLEVAPAHGSLTLDFDGRFLYVPNPFYFGSDSFTFNVSDGLLSSSGRAEISVTAINSPPQAVEDTAELAEDGFVLIDVRANDRDPDGDALTISAVSAPEHGEATIDSGRIRYTPDANFFGADSFSYTLSDGKETGAAAVTIKVNSLNDVPTANLDLATLDEDSSVVIDVLANDSDVEGDPLRLLSVSVPAHGKALIESGAVRYTPAANFFGRDSFTYAVTDNKDSSSATVTIDVLPVDDDPVARDDSRTTNEDVSVLIPVLANDSDVDAVGLMVDSLSAAAHGTVALEGAGVRYVPAANYHGTDGFSYTLRDGKGRTAGASVSVSINPVADAPDATLQAFTTPEDTRLSAHLVATDADGDTLSFALNEAPSHGHLTLGTDGLFEYQPNADFSGSDSFVFRVSDGLTIVAARAEITVEAVNDAPQALDDVVLLARGSSARFDVRGNDSDVEGDPLTIVLLGGPTNGELLAQPDGSFLYTPLTGFSGEDSFQYRASDGHLQSAPATVHLVVSTTNHAPVAVADTADTDEDAPVTIKVLANDTDADGDPLAVASLSTPLHGSAVVNADGSVTYTPAANYFGGDSFTYRTNDGLEDSDVATVSLTIAPVNDAPVAVDDSATTAEDTPIVLNLLANDTDVDSTTLSVMSLTAPLHGSAVVNADGTVTYTPFANFFGTDGFDYTLSDGHGGQDVGSVSVSITALNDPPQAVEDTAELAEDSSVLIDVRANDSDPDGDALELTAVSAPVHGTAVIDGGAVRYTPVANFYGRDSFTYTVSDANESRSASVTINVRPVDDLPVARDDLATTDEDQPVLIAVLANDSDADSVGLTIDSLTAAAHGTVVIEGDSVRYTPAANYGGADGFSYTLRDGKGRTATASVAVSIAPVNDAPTLATISDQALFEGQTLSFPLVANDIDGDTLSFSLSGVGASLDASGHFSFTALDGDVSHSFTVQVSDGQSVAERSFSVVVTNVAPTLGIIGTADAPGGLPYTIRLAASDPGDDAISAWMVNWGDGRSDSLPGSATEATHLYSRAGGSFNIEASATDEDGSYAAAPLHVNVSRDLLDVERLTPTATGFKVRFDHVFDAGTINLHDPAGGLPDVQLIGDLGGTVSGSLLLDADGRGFSFIRSGGILPFDSYSVRLASGPSGFHDAVSALDGNGDGTAGDDYRTRFDFLSIGAGVLSLPDFMRGPGQAVNVPATGKLLPVSFSSPGGMHSLVFTVDYDPHLLDITDAMAGSGLPAGSEVRLESAARDTGGQRARITVILPDKTALAAGSTRLVDLVAQVPVSAPYGAKHILDLSVESIDGGALPAGSVADDDALHLVGYFGDTSGNAAYSTLDGQQIQRVLVKLDPGFAAYPNVDPLIIADINGSGTLTSIDASRVLQEVSYLTGASSVDRVEIPPIPAGIGPLRFSGPDPRVDIPVDAIADPGELVTVPIRIDTAVGLEAVQLRIGYDASRFDFVGVRRGSLTGDFGWFITGQESGRITVDMSRLDALQEGSGTLLDIDLRVRADALPGVSAVDLQYASLNDGRLTLNVVPQLGADATDGRITIVGKAVDTRSPVLVAQPVLAEDATVVAAPERAAGTPSDTLPGAQMQVFAGWWQAAPISGSATSSAPVIDLTASFSLPAAVSEAILADGKSKPWLKDYLGNVRQARKASPNSGLKVTIPVSAASSRTTLVQYFNDWRAL